METLIKDFRYGLRSLLKHPGFTAIAVLTLALGIGANTVIFSVINALFLKSLPYDDPQRIVLAWGDIPAEGKRRSQVSATDVDDWRHQNTSFEDLTTFANWTPTFLDNGEPERITGIQVGDGYFRIMRGTPLLGRVFLPEEQEEKKDLVIVLGYELWQRRFGGDQNVVGKKLNLSGQSYTVVGVMPADFRSLPSSLIGKPGQFYRPVAEPHDEEDRASRHLRSIARLKPGVTIGQAQADMDVIAGRLEQAHPKSNSGYKVRLVTLPEDTVGGLRSTLLILFGAVAFVLLIACANVGNLLLARSGARQKEIAIRAALGAGRRRLIRQFLAESLWLAVSGGVIGLLLAIWGTNLVESLGSQVTPLLSKISIDGQVLSFTAAIAVLTTLIFGLAPALHASKPDLIETLKAGGRGSGAATGSHRMRGTLVVAEIAMALLLLVCAGLLIRSVMRLREVNPGFNDQNLLTMNVPLPLNRYPKDSSWVTFYDRLARRTEALPGVASVGLTSILPFSDNFDGRALAIEDHPVPPGRELSVDLYIVTPNYLKTMAIPLRDGRSLDDHDAANTPLTALINQTMARQLWPGQSPIGKRIKFPGSEKNPQPWRTIVGIVGDVKQYALDRETPMQIYLPEAQYPTSGMTLAVRTSTDPSSLITGTRDEIHGLDPLLAIDSVATMEQLLADSISLRRLTMLLLIVFAALALTLAAIGIYGVMNYAVTQRTHELGIRMALGAGSANVLGLVIKSGMTLVMSGVAIGLVGAFAVTRVIGSLLFGITPTDAGTFVAVSVFLILVALLACYVPARRATRVDPLVALRNE